MIMVCLDDSNIKCNYMLRSKSCIEDNHTFLFNFPCFDETRRTKIDKKE